jgi:hypothetical protein
MFFPQNGHQILVFTVEKVNVFMDVHARHTHARHSHVMHDHVKHCQVMPPMSRMPYVRNNSEMPTVAKEPKLI